MQDVIEKFLSVFKSQQINSCVRLKKNTKHHLLTYYGLNCFLIMECDNVIAARTPALKITYQRNASEEQEVQMEAMLRFFIYSSVCSTSYSLSFKPIQVQCLNNWCLLC